MYPIIDLSVYPFLFLEKLEESVKVGFEPKERKEDRKGDRIPTNMRRLYSKKSKVSRRIMKTKCVVKLTQLRDKLRDIEDKILEIKNKWKNKVESKVIDEIKINFICK